MIEKELESNTEKAMLQNIQKSVSSITSTIVYHLQVLCQDYYLN